MSNMTRFAIAAILCLAGATLLFTSNGYFAEIRRIRGLYIVGGILLILAGIYQFYIINRNANSGNQGDSR